MVAYEDITLEKSKTQEVSIEINTSREPLQTSNDNDLSQPSVLKIQ